MQSIKSVLLLLTLVSISLVSVSAQTPVTKQLIQQDVQEAFTINQTTTWQLLYQFPELWRDITIVETAFNINESRAQFLLSLAKQKDPGLSTTAGSLVASEHRQACSPSFCGDGILCQDEQCDDGNSVNNDGCSALCTVEIISPGICGDGYISGAEQCEPPGTRNAVACAQEEVRCDGRHTLTRSGFGNCREDCMCAFDPAESTCVRNQCGASCGADSDCNDGMRCDLSACACVPLPPNPDRFCGDGKRQTSTLDKGFGVPEPEECDFTGTRIINHTGFCAIAQTCVNCKLVNVIDTSASQAEICDGIDNDCNGIIDDFNPDLCVNQDSLCEQQLGVCQGAHRTCGGADGFNQCSTAEYNASGNYQDQENLCDGLDNDCDGSVDEGCLCTDGIECSTNKGVCSRGFQACVNGILGECENAVFPTAEQCDSLDNDCDGQVDECVTNSCGQCQAQGFEVCNYKDDNCNAELLSPTQGVFDFDKQQYTAFSHYCPPGKLCRGALADGIDNDGNGLIDEGIDEGVKWRDDSNWCEVCYDLSKVNEQKQFVANAPDSFTNALRFSNKLFGQGRTTVLSSDQDAYSATKDIIGRKVLVDTTDIACCRYDQCIANGQCYDLGQEFDIDGDGTFERCEYGGFLADTSFRMPNATVQTIIVEARNRSLHKVYDGPLPNSYPKGVLWSEEHNAEFVYGSDAYMPSTDSYDKTWHSGFFIRKYDRDGALEWEDRVFDDTESYIIAGAYRARPKLIASHFYVDNDGYLHVFGSRHVTTGAYQTITYYSWGYSVKSWQTVKNHVFTRVYDPQGRVESYNFTQKYAGSTNLISIGAQVLGHYPNGDGAAREGYNFFRYNKKEILWSHSIPKYPPRGNFIHKGNAYVFYQPSYNSPYHMYGLNGSGSFIGDYKFNPYEYITSENDYGFHSSYIDHDDTGIYMTFAGYYKDGYWSRVSDAFLIKMDYEFKPIYMINLTASTNHIEKGTRPAIGFVRNDLLALGTDKQIHLYDKRTGAYKNSTFTLPPSSLLWNSQIAMGPKHITYLSGKSLVRLGYDLPQESFDSATKIDMELNRKNSTSHPVTSLAKLTGWHAYGTIEHNQGIVAAQGAIGQWGNTDPTWFSYIDDNGKILNDTQLIASDPFAKQAFQNTNVRSFIDINDGKVEGTSFSRFLHYEFTTGHGAYDVSMKSTYDGNELQMVERNSPPQDKPDTAKFHQHMQTALDDDGTPIGMSGNPLENLKLSGELGRTYYPTTADDIFAYVLFAEGYPARLKLRIYAKSTLRLLKEIDLEDARDRSQYRIAASNGRVAISTQGTIYLVSFGTPAWKMNASNALNWWEIPEVHMEDDELYMFHSGTDVSKYTFDGNVIGTYKAIDDPRFTYQIKILDMTKTDTGIAMVFTGGVSSGYSELGVGKIDIP